MKINHNSNNKVRYPTNKVEMKNTKNSRIHMGFHSLQHGRGKKNQVNTNRTS